MDPSQTAQSANEPEVFMEALEFASPEKRCAYLDQACAGDAALRQRVESLLRHHAKAAEFLETPAVSLQDATGRIEDPAVSGPSPAPVSHSDRTEVLLVQEQPRLDFLSPSDDPAALGCIGLYTVTGVIGRGGMGIVLKARDASLNRVVAIKVLVPELAGNATARKRFLREARAAAAVVHQHVVTIHAVAEESPPYLVMEYVDGQSLQDKLDATGPHDLRGTLRIGAQVALGLAAAHAHGVIHRDIKPSNILLENGVERVRITDFGLARAADDVEITRPGEVAGTPQYMSPEQAQGQPVDARSDLFSFGCVLYAMCTGRPPFRAESTIAAIRRVCDDTPRPIREINAEVPEWLTEIIERLLAKRPEERFQTAQEVAQLLGQHLAHVQDPGSTPLPARVHTAKPGFSKKPGLSRRWVAAALLLLGVVSTFGVTEATGLTHIAGTVIRIVTGEGTLIIEIDDPTVQVSLDGEELTISGGGVQEVRLRPGQYQFLATRNGQSVKQEVVTITRGGQRIVAVTREADAQAISAPQRTPEPGAFVVIGGKGVTERKFETLVDAVLGASDGDTIEVRGNGPFVPQALHIGTKGLTIRAATGFRPVIKGNAVGENFPWLIDSQGPLVLEGLELHMTGEPGSAAVKSDVAPLHIANCRFVLASSHSLSAVTPNLAVRNCEFVGTATGNHHMSLDLVSDGKITLENNVIISPFGHALGLRWPRRDLHNVTVQLKHNTVVSPPVAIIQHLLVVPELAEPGAAADRQPLQMQVSGNVFDLSGSTSRILALLVAPPLSIHEAETLLPRLMAWREQQNLYTGGLSFHSLRQVNDPSDPERSMVNSPLPTCQTLADWQRLWNADDSGSLQGEIRYEGGDVLARVKQSPEQTDVGDFRLRPDSPGYGAAEGGKNLGADIDLVGPGAAYERWKKTAEYDVWLKETGQVK